MTTLIVMGRDNLQDGNMFKGEWETGIQFPWRKAIDELSEW